MIKGLYCPIIGLSLSLLFFVVGCDDKPKNARVSKSQRDAPNLRISTASSREIGELGHRIKSLTSRSEVQGDELDALYNRLDSVSPQGFDEVWSSLQELKISAYLKYRLLSRCLHGLALAGEFDKALALAKLESASANRITLLSGVFGGARGDIQTTISEFEKLSKAERAGVVGGLAESLASCGKLSLEDFASIGKITPELKSGLISGLDLYVGQDANRFRELKEICKSLEAQGGDNAGIFEMVLSFRAAEHLESVMGEFKSMEKGEGQGWRRLISELTKRDPEGVLRTLLGRGDVEDVRYAVSSWSEVDYMNVFNWFSSNKADIDSKFADGMLAEFVEHQLKTKSVDEAYALVQNVEDEHQRSRLQGRVWSFERDQLRAAVSAEPTETIKAIVEGTSYSDYWLEEAMGTWISKDFERAQAWYQENWNKLPANKSQFLAAAFANQAASQGDTATARQWAAHIQDTKTKQRIDAGIAKAEAAKNH